MKKQKLAALIMCGTILMSGCSLINGNNEILDLPPNPQSFDQVYDEDTGDTTIKVNGRTYSYFGRLKDKMSNDSIRECLGYVDGDKNLRIYSLGEDPYDNYIMVKNIGGIMDQPVFLRAIDTRLQDVYTPSYIESAGYECWGSSGMHYEMPEATIRFTCNAENIMLIDYEVMVNGEYAGCGQTGYITYKAITKGDIFEVEINEATYGSKADKDKPFDVAVTFTVTDTDNNAYEVDGVYEREMMFGAVREGLEIRYDEDMGYYLYEDV